MITNEEKKEIVAKNRLHDSDSGSSDVQVAILTRRIDQVTEHLKKNRKDFSSRRGLLAMVSRRRRLLDYLASTDHGRYRSLIERLNIRK